MDELQNENSKYIDLLTRIVHEYIVSAHPVGSLFLAEKYRLPMSSATIRNAMALLEEEGYMYQPHASAGRIPTEEGYRVYIRYMKPVRASKRQHEVLEEIWRRETAQFEQRVKKLAKALSSLCGEIVFVAFDRDTVFYTGLSSLSEKPEFENREMIARLSSVVDSLDETVRELFDQIGDEPEILIGKKDAVSELCSAILISYRAGPHKGIVGILGPSRMHYARNVTLLKETKSLIEE